MGIEDLYKRLDKKISEMGVRIKDANQYKVQQDVFDEVTLLALYKLVTKGLISEIGGPISTGKEANVFFGSSGEQSIAIKIYRIQTGNFKAMTEYMIGDRRFSNIRKNRKDIIFAWTKKEFSNLKRAHDAGLLVPEPIAFDRNILLMEFIGEDEEPYPQLRLVELENPGEVYQKIIEFIHILFNKAKLVHADLSEYNILMGKEPVFIDMGQAVLPEHPKAISFLMRDIKNINRFFTDKCEIIDENKLLEDLIGLSSGEI
jgi:RIO kinase 1